LRTLLTRLQTLSNPGPVYDDTPFWRIFCASQVCQDWRAFLLGPPAVWAKIIQLDALLHRHQLMNRTKSCPLSISGNILGEKCKGGVPFFTRLRDNWYRIRSLDLVISYAHSINSRSWDVSQFWRILKSTLITFQTGFLSQAILRSSTAAYLSYGAMVHGSLMSTSKPRGCHRSGISFYPLAIFLACHSIPSPKWFQRMGQLESLTSFCLFTLQDSRTLEPTHLPKLQHPELTEYVPECAVLLGSLVFPAGCSLTVDAVMLRDPTLAGVLPFRQRVALASRTYFGHHVSKLLKIELRTYFFNLTNQIDHAQRIGHTPNFLTTLGSGTLVGGLSSSSIMLDAIPFGQFAKVTDLHLDILMEEHVSNRECYFPFPRCLGNNILIRQQLGA